MKIPEPETPEQDERQWQDDPAWQREYEAWLDEQDQEKE